jgi:hypothetical protein
MDKWISEINSISSQAFDFALITAKLKLQQNTKPGSNLNVTQLAAILWKNAELLTDSIYGHVRSVNLIEQLMSRKHETLSSVSYLELTNSVFAFLI